jgi:unsaturated rhamnogalacturonyl hydrolase
MGLKAIKAVIENIDETGELQHVSAGTAMGETQEFYKLIPVTAMPYGQSMAILSLVEYLHHRI